MSVREFHEFHNEIHNDHHHDLAVQFDRRLNAINLAFLLWDCCVLNVHYVTGENNFCSLASRLWWILFCEQKNVKSFLNKTIMLVNQFQLLLLLFFIFVFQTFLREIVFHLKYTMYNYMYIMVWMIFKIEFQFEIFLVREIVSSSDVRLDSIGKPNSN